MKVIKLSGRIDSNNAGIVESEISSQLAENPAETPTFDAENLTYISRAGLRVLLKAGKKYRAKLDVLNVSDEVYNIFDVTGFTELFNVRKKLREIFIDGLEIIGRGGFSTVYRLDAETVIKVFDKNSAGFEEAEQDRTASRETFIHGIPTAIAYDTVKAGEYYGLVYEMIDADTLAATVKNHPERLSELSAKTAHLLKKLHTTEFEPGTFRDGREKLREMIQKSCGGEDIRKLNENSMGLSAQTLGAMWDIITQKYFGISDKDILSRYSETMNEYSSLFMLYILTFGNPNPKYDDRRKKAAEIMSHLREVSVNIKTIEGI